MHGRRLEGIDVVSGEVGVQARCEDALLVLLVPEARGADRVEPDGLDAREPLGGVVMALQRLDGEHGIEGGDRRVGSRADLHAAIQHGAEGVHRRGPVAPHGLLVEPPDHPMSYRTPAGPRWRVPASRPVPPAPSRPSRSAPAVPPRPEVPPFAGVERLVDALPHRQHLVDRAVADRVNADLQPCGMPSVEELGQLVVVEVAGARTALAVGGVQPRGTGTDRTVDRQVADRRQAVVDGHAEIGGRDDRHRVDRQTCTMSEEHLEVARAVPMGHRHLVDGRDASRGGEGCRLQLQILSLVVARGRQRPGAHHLVGLLRHASGRRSVDIQLRAGKTEHPGAFEGRAVRERDVPVRATDHQGTSARSVEVGERGHLRPLPACFVVPEQEHGPLPPGRAPGARGGEEVLPRSSRLDIGVHEREPGVVRCTCA